MAIINIVLPYNHKWYHKALWYIKFHYLLYYLQDLQDIYAFNTLKKLYFKIKNSCIYKYIQIYTEKIDWLLQQIRW